MDRQPFLEQADDSTTIARPDVSTTIARPDVSTTTTRIHVMALDGLVNVNSLFTVAVFVGFSLTTPAQKSLENKSACDAGDDVAKRLLLYEVGSFSCFLFSSLLAQGLKLAINVLNSKDVDEAVHAHIHANGLRSGMVLSAVGSVLGCVFLVLSMIDVIQIRLGLLSCGSFDAVLVVILMAILVFMAVILYIFAVCYAFKSHKKTSVPAEGCIS